MAIMSIALTNLGKYNEGVLDFVWLDLPATDEEIAKAFDQIEVSHDDVQYFSDGRGHVVDEDDPEMCGEYEEFFITDYECDFYRIGEYADLDELNEIAEKIADLDADQADVVRAIMDAISCDVEEAIDAADDAMIFYGCYDMTDVAYQYVDELGYLDGVPENIANYFDYEAFGRDLEFDGSWFELPDGSLGVLWN